MSLSAICLLLVWFLLMLVASLVAILILSRRGSRGWFFSVLVLLGAVGSFVLLWADAGGAEARLFGAGSLAIFLIGCIGLRTPKRSSAKCWNCGYDLTGATSGSSACCPECGVIRPKMRGHCLQCKADVRQALAAGSILCPDCGAQIAEPR